MPRALSGRHGAGRSVEIAAKADDIDHVVRAWQHRGARLACAVWGSRWQVAGHARPGKLALGRPDEHEALRARLGNAEAVVWRISVRDEQASADCVHAQKPLARTTTLARL